MKFASSMGNKQWILKKYKISFSLDCYWLDAIKVTFILRLLPKRNTLLLKLIIHIDAYG